MFIYICKIMRTSDPPSFPKPTLSYLIVVKRGFHCHHHIILNQLFTLQILVRFRLSNLSQIRFFCLSLPVSNPRGSAVRRLDIGRKLQNRTIQSSLDSRKIRIETSREKRDREREIDERGI